VARFDLIQRDGHVIDSANRRDSINKAPEGCTSIHLAACGRMSAYDERRMSTSNTDLTKFLRGLRAVREFTAEPVSDDVLNDILEVGRWTSTGGNRQGTEVVVIRDADVKRRIGDWGARPAAGASVVLLLVTNGDAGVLDEGRMAERLALAARAHGLGSILATLKNEGPVEIRKLLGIPDDKRTVAVVPIGHIDREARKALPPNPNGGRKPIEQFAHRERF